MVAGRAVTMIDSHTGVGSLASGSRYNATRINARTVGISGTAANELPILGKIIAVYIDPIRMITL